MSRQTLIGIAQPVATLLVAASVTVLALVEIGIIPSSRITTQVSGGGLSSYDTLNVRLVDNPSVLIGGSIGIMNSPGDKFWVNGLSCGRY